jgi:hypothetical protein
MSIESESIPIYFLVNVLIRGARPTRWGPRAALPSLPFPSLAFAFAFAFAFVLYSSCILYFDV